MVLGAQFGGQGDFTDTLENSRAGASTVGDIVRRPIHTAIHSLVPAFGAAHLEHRLDRRDGGTTDTGSGGGGAPDPGPSYTPSDEPPEHVRLW